MDLLEHLRKLINDTPMLRELALEIEHIENGYCRCSLPVTPQLLNPHGVLHGGVSFTLADTGMGFALYSTLEPDERPTTINANIHYIRPPEGKRITAHCRVVDRQSRLAVVRTEVQDDGGKIISVVDGAFLIYRLKG